MTAPAPLSFLSPEAKVREIDLSAYSRGAAATVVGLIGTFEKGPVATPTRVRNVAQAQALFGSFLATEWGMHAVQHFFNNGGQELSIVRTAHYTDVSDASTLTAVKATLTLVDRDGSPANTIRIDALSEGAWGNGATGGISVAVVDGIAASATEFGIHVYWNGVLVETFNDLNLTTTSPDYVERRINGNSQFITATDLLSATAAPNNRPAILAESSGDLASGDDGLTSLADADFTGDSGAGTGFHAFNGETDLRVLIAPGRTGNVVDLAMIAYCEARQDCVALCEVPQGQSVTNAIAYRNQTSPFSGTKFDSSYGAVCWPWFNMTDPVLLTERTMPPTGAIAGMFARSDAAAGQWAAPAGVQRGTIRGINSLETSVGKIENDLVFPNDVNAVRSIANVGFVMYGQNTLQIRTTALDRLNVRRMLIFVETGLRGFAEQLLFEPNNPTTWAAFKRVAQPFMQAVQDAGGITQFGIQVDETNNTSVEIEQNRMNINVFVKPTKTAEFITLNVNVTSQGVDIEEIFSQV